MGNEQVNQDLRLPSRTIVQKGRLAVHGSLGLMITGYKQSLWETPTTKVPPDEEVTFPANDEMQLHVWLIPAVEESDEPAPTVVHLVSENTETNANFLLDELRASTK